MSVSVRAPARLELAETSHKIKSAKMRSGAEMKVALETLDRQMSITRASSDMQQALMRQHLEDLLVLSRRLAAGDVAEATCPGRARTAAAVLPTRRFKDRPVVAPSLSEEHAFRERLLRRLQLLNCMRLPSNYSKRLLADDEQSDIDITTVPWTPHIFKRSSADRPTRPKTSPSHGRGERCTKTVGVHATDQSGSQGSGSTQKGRKECSARACAQVSESRYPTENGECISGDSASQSYPSPPLPESAKGSSGRCGSSRRLVQSSSRRSARSSAGQSSRPFISSNEPNAGDDNDIRIANTTQTELIERQKRFYDSLRVLRRLSISDFLVGLRHSIPSEASTQTLAHNEDQISEETLQREFKDVLGYCRKTAISLTWKPVVKVI